MAGMEPEDTVVGMVVGTGPEPYTVDGMEPEDTVVGTSPEPYDTVAGTESEDTMMVGMDPEDSRGVEYRHKDFGTELEEKNDTGDYTVSALAWEWA